MCLTLLRIPAIEFNQYFRYINIDLLKNKTYKMKDIHFMRKYYTDHTVSDVKLDDLMIKDPLEMYYSWNVIHENISAYQYCKYYYLWSKPSVRSDIADDQEIIVNSNIVQDQNGYYVY